MVQGARWKELGVGGDYQDWVRRSTSFQGMAGWTGATFIVATTDRPEQVTGSQRTPGFFTMEGLPMMLGRDFLPEEGRPGRNHVVILSNRLWSQHFGADRNIVGVSCTCLASQQSRTDSGAQV